MATEQQTKQATKRLKQWIDIDKQVVTYRQIARELGVHVNVAKNILLNHYNANPSLYATYHLSGLLLPPGSQYTSAQATNGHLGKNGESSRSQLPADDAMDVDEENSFSHVKEQQKSWVNKAVEETDVRPEPIPRHAIVLAGSDTFEAKQQMFFPDSLRVHVYSLAFGAIKDPAMYLTPALLLRSHPTYHDPAKYGTISGGAFKAVAPPAAPAMKNGAMSFASTSTSKASESKASSRKPAEVKSEPPAPSKGKSAKVTTEESITKMSSTAVKKEGTASAMYTNSSGPKPPSAATSGNKSGADPNLRGKLKGKAVRRIDSEEEEEPEEEKPQPVPAKGKAKEVPKTASTENEEMLQAMFDMPIDIDDDDYADIEDAPRPNQEAKKSQKKATVKKRPSTAQPQDTDMSGDDAAKSKSTSGRPRKRRRVTKTETSVDDKGYMVSKDVSGSESYSSSGEETSAQARAKPNAKPRKSDTASTTTVDAKPKPKPKPAPPAKKGGKPGQQSSLMGFFTKKT